MKTGRLVVGVTGASGAIYAQRFLMQAVHHYDEIYLCVSEHAIQVIKTEQFISLDRKNFSTIEWLGKDYPHIQLMPEKDYFCPPASGSFRHDGMVILPCSVATAGKIANGIGDNLLTRAAEVCLKEHRKLILVPREMPWSVITLRNFTLLAESGVIILPASPSWYHNPKNLEELADSVVARILQNLNVSQDLFKEWMVKKNG